MDPFNIKSTNDHIGDELLKFDEKIDHTLNEKKENLQQMVLDDFEHVEHELLPNLTASGNNLIDKFDLTKSSPPPSHTHQSFLSNEAPKEIIDFVTKTEEDKKLEDLHSTNKGMSILNDFMDFERQQNVGPPPQPQKPPSPVVPVVQPQPTSHTDIMKNVDIEDDYLNPYSMKNNMNDKKDNLISSEDLVEPIKSTIDNKIKDNFTLDNNLLNDFDLDKDLPSFNSIKTEATVHDIKLPAIPDEPLKDVIKEVEKKTVTPPSPSPVVQVSNVKSKEMISAEEMFCRIGLDAWFKPERLHPKVESLVYWRDTKKSGIVFGVGLALLLAMSCFSLISVFAYVSLLGLLGTVSFRIYKNILQAVQKTSEGHPFKEYFELDLTLSQEKVQDCVNVSVAHINAFTSELRRLFLVEDLVDSVKFGLFLWCLTYLGAWFNGMTLVILVFVALFTLPKVYENNKQSIDTYLDLVRSKILEITDKVKAAIPIGKKVESEKDK